MSEEKPDEATKLTPPEVSERKKNRDRARAFARGERGLFKPPLGALVDELAKKREEAS